MQIHHTLLLHIQYILTYSESRTESQFDMILCSFLSFAVLCMLRLILWQSSLTWVWTILLFVCFFPQFKDSVPFSAFAFSPLWLCVFCSHFADTFTIRAKEALELHTIDFRYLYNMKVECTKSIIVSKTIFALLCCFHI